MSKITILGSINIDIVQETSRLPKIGETMLSGAVDYFLGGKGSNQAVAASRVGGDVDLIACVGKDSFGETALKHLQREKVNCDSIAIKDGTFTGIATIFKLPSDNAILVSSGANFVFDDSDIKKVENSLNNSRVFLTQLEVPLQTIKESLMLAKQKEILTILNPAPYNKHIKDMLPYVDIITPNETEFEGLCGNLIESGKGLERTMVEWEKQNPTKLVLTRGAYGVSFVEDDQVVTIPSIKANVVDTTGAGDTFNGILATMLCQGNTVRSAIETACVGASISVEGYGAQVNMPTIEKIQARKR